MKRGQVWVETVIYTLIGLVIIGIVLAFVTPRVNEFRDRAVIEQSISSLNAIDAKMNEILLAPGNRRVVEFELRRGEIFFDAKNDLILFEMNDSRVIFSEPGISTQLGRINVTTKEGSKRHSVSLSIRYGFDMLVEGNESIVKKFSPAAVPYRFAFENKGFSTDGGEIIDVDEVS